MNGPLFLPPKPSVCPVSICTRRSTGSLSKKVGGQRGVWGVRCLGVLWLWWRIWGNGIRGDSIRYPSNSTPRNPQIPPPSITPGTQEWADHFLDPSLSPASRPNLCPVRRGPRLATTAPATAFALELDNCGNVEVWNSWVVMGLGSIVFPHTGLPEQGRECVWKGNECVFGKMSVFGKTSVCLWKR